MTPRTHILVHEQAAGGSLPFGVSRFHPYSLSLDMGGNLNRLVKFGARVMPFVGRELCENRAPDQGTRRRRSEGPDPKISCFVLPLGRSIGAGCRLD